MANKWIVTTALTVFAFASCKPKAESGSSVASLDNMTRDAGAALSVNFCGVKLDKNSAKNLAWRDQFVIRARISAPNDALRYAAAGALTAVPKTMQQMFFATRGGKIVVTSDVQSKCKEGKPSDAKLAFFAETRKNGDDYQLDGCWSAEGERLMIYVKDDAEVIHHGLLRLFASAYSEFFTKRLELFASSIPKKFRGESARRVDRFKRQKAALVKAFLQDVEKDDPKKAEHWTELQKEDAAAFENQVFAETIDSAYCSAATAHIMETRFPAVTAVVNEGADSFKKDFGTTAQ